MHGLSDNEYLIESINKHQQPLQKLDGVTGWKMFRAPIEEAFRFSRRGQEEDHRSIGEDISPFPRCIDKRLDYQKRSTLKSSSNPSKSHALLYYQCLASST